MNWELPVAALNEPDAARSRVLLADAVLAATGAPMPWAAVGAHNSGFHLWDEKTDMYGLQHWQMCSAYGAAHRQSRLLRFDSLADIGGTLCQKCVLSLMNSIGAASDWVWSSVRDLWEKLNDLESELTQWDALPTDAAGWGARYRLALFNLSAVARQPGAGEVAVALVDGVTARRAELMGRVAQLAAEQLGDSWLTEVLSALSGETGAGAYQAETVFAQSPTPIAFENSKYVRYQPLLTWAAELVSVIPVETAGVTVWVVSAPRVVRRELMNHLSATSCAPGVPVSVDAAHIAAGLVVTDRVPASEALPLANALAADTANSASVLPV
jgi:hypothetical protein